MKIVVPDGVEIVPVFLTRQDQLRFLPLVLGDQNDIAWFRRLARDASDRTNDIFCRAVLYFLGRVEAEAVEMKLVDPVTTVANEELADRAGIRSVKINRFTLIVVFVTPGEVMIGENSDVVSVRTEMIVNNVEDHSQAQRMRTIDKRA